MSALPMIRLSGETLVTTSRTISEHFQKRHDDVLKSIRNLDCSEEFNLRNFAEIEYVDGKGRKYPAYEITKDGFMFLVMGYTGQRAAQWKERFIAEFNRMADILNRKLPQFGRRGKTVVTRKLEREIFELFVAGLGKKQISVALSAPFSTVSQILHGKYQFSASAGVPEFTQELIVAVVARHFDYEKERQARERERLAQRYLSGSHNMLLANSLDRLGREMLN